jgi:branched-chain amino acid transport system ATP-binding protein
MSVEAPATMEKCRFGRLLPVTPSKRGASDAGAVWSECGLWAGHGDNRHKHHLRAISGLVRPRSGSIEFDGDDISSLPAYEIVEHGIAHVPEGRRVFPEMTVQENLEIGAYIPRAKAERRRTLELVFTIFPRLAQRKNQLSGTMSGGEQQMLAIGRGLMLKPRLLMLDEPSLGLAPVVIDSTFDAIQKIHSLGMSILLVEQNAARALTLVRRAYVLEGGEIVMQGTSDELANNDQMTAAYLGTG